MPELTVTARTEWMSQELSARVATLALDVAAVLELHCSPESGAADAVAFLRSWAETTTASPPATTSGPLDRLVARFGLTERECDLLLLAGLPEEHEGLSSTMRQLHPQGEPRPTTGLAAVMFDDRPAVRRLLTGGAVIRHGLLRLDGNGTFFERSLVLADSLWEALHGDDTWPAMIGRVQIGAAPRGLARWLSSCAAGRAVAALRATDARTLLVSSPDETVSLGRCAALAEAAGVRLVAGRLAADDEAALELLAAHAAARGAVPVAVSSSADAALAAPDLPGPLLVCAPPGTVRPGPHRAVLTVALGPITVADHRDAWRAALPHLADQAPLLAARHPVDPALTAQVAIDLRSHQRLGADPPDVSNLIRTRAGMNLPVGIDLVTPAVPWTRLVLPADVECQLRDAVARLGHQSLVLDDWGFLDHARASRGARLLFTGLPGTGKSLAAETVATAAGTDLLLVDVSRVVSKWIGETEKNLAAAFDVAERTQAALFFDEADALFGARTEITDAHDRYANLETAYLLQRLDRFDGLALLATNLRHNIDAAFMRRMDFVVEFPLPDIAGRQALWTLHLPADVCSADVDTDSLARLYPVPGGWIRNAAIAAAFLAAADGDRIGQHHLVAAMRREYAKAALPFPGEPPRRRDDYV